MADPIAAAFAAAAKATAALARARAKLARTLADVDPDDLPCLPEATRVNGGRRFPWKLVLQFVPARDLARALAPTHRAARTVCNHRATVARIVEARHRGGCERAKDAKCTCAGCTRVAMLLDAAALVKTRPSQQRQEGGVCWLRRLCHTEAAARFVDTPSTAARHAFMMARTAGVTGLRDGAIVQIEGACGEAGESVNGVFYFFGGPNANNLAWLKRNAVTTAVSGNVGPAVSPGAMWLFLANDSRWYVSLTEDMVGREPEGWIHHPDEVQSPANENDPKPLPHDAAAGQWAVAVGDAFQTRPAITVRAITWARAAVLEAAAAATWEAAAARAPRLLRMAGFAVPAWNGTYEIAPDERPPGTAPVYKWRAPAEGDAEFAEQWWLFLALDNMWCVGNSESKDARSSRLPFAFTAVAVADGVLPHEAPEGGWTASNAAGAALVPQPTLRVTAVVD